jgi:predicted RNA-binding Zn-ribbon protein involved in translation (DUF1610 family)
VSNPILERFRSLDSTYLLHYAAFEIQDYTPEARDYLRTVLFERGIDDAQVKAYRFKRFPFPTMDVECTSCGEKLTIERQELNEGRFTCPECGMAQSVLYPEIPVDFDDSALTGRPLPDSVVAEHGADESILPQLASNPVAAVLGQGPGSLKIALGDAELSEDGRLAGEGLPDTVCAKCGRTIMPEETCLAAENFYCEACYEQLTPEEKALVPEEEVFDEEEDEEEEESDSR